MKLRSAHVPLWLFLGLLVAILTVRLAAEWGLLVPVCGFRTITGRPCPLCGSTRSLLAWSELDLASAFLLNPLTFVACVSIVATFVLWASDRQYQSCSVARIGALLSRRSARLAIVAGVVLNWLYLLAQPSK